MKRCPFMLCVILLICCCLNFSDERENIPCSSGQNFNGTCQNIIPCLVRGGSPHQAIECTNLKRCCLDNDSCGKETNATSVKFTNKKYPNFDSKARVCELKMRLAPDTCGLSVQIHRMETEATLDLCLIDQFFFLPLHDGDVMNPICGNKTDIQGSTFINSTRTPVITFVNLVQSTNYRWEVNITQLKVCNSEESGEQSCGETILTSHEYPDLGDNQNILMTPEDLTIVEKFHNPTGSSLFKSKPPSNSRGKYSEVSVPSLRQADTEALLPFIGVLVYQPANLLLCNVVLVSSYDVLVPAHCIYVDFITADKLKIAFKYFNVTNNEWSVVYRGVSRIKVNWAFRYSDFFINNNLVMLELNQTVNHTAPVCLPQPQATEYDNDQLVLMKWRSDRTLGTRKIADPLQRINITLLTHEKCKTAWSLGSSDQVEVLNNTLCFIDNQELYQEDKSSILLYNTRGKYRLAAIYNHDSQDFGLNDTSLPVVFTKISAYMDWIWVNLRKE